MTEEEKRSKGGRPATGRQYPHKVFGYFDDAGMEQLRRLAQRHGGEAAALRLAVRKLAEAEGLG